jgi:hypothetical protein
MTSRWLSLGASVALPFLLIAGCSLINAPDEVRPGEGGEGGEGGGNWTTTNASSSSSSSSSASSSSASSSSASSGSGGSMMVCTPGATESCYEGPGGTENVGACKGGVRVCDPMGAGFGPCTGQVLPAQEDCATGLVDEDCNGAPKNGCKPRVIFVSAVGNPYADEIINTQLGTGAFDKFDLFDAQIGTPTLAQLQQYDVALAISNSTFQDPVQLGNVLADYFDGGGRVVLALFAVSSGWAVQGRFGDPAMKYMLLSVSAFDSGAESLGEVAEPQSPLMNGVASLSAASVIRNSGGEINGAVVVARWSSGRPLVVRGVVNGRNRADLNVFPPPSYFGSGNHVELLRNALLFE